MYGYRRCLGTGLLRNISYMEMRQMKLIEKQTFDEERALYGSKGVVIRECSFDGPADGESAVKEASDIQAEKCFFNLRYPFWHVHGQIGRAHV